MKKINFEMNEFVELDVAVAKAIGKTEVAFALDTDNEERIAFVHSLKAKIKEEHVNPHESEIRTLELTDGEAKEAREALRAYIEETKVKAWYVANGYVESALDALKKVEA